MTGWTDAARRASAAARARKAGSSAPGAKTKRTKGPQVTSAASAAKKMAAFANYKGRFKANNSMMAERAASSMGLMTRKPYVSPSRMATNAAISARVSANAKAQRAAYTASRTSGTLQRRSATRVTVSKNLAASRKARLANRRRKGI